MATLDWDLREEDDTIKLKKLSKIKLKASIK